MDQRTLKFELGDFLTANKLDRDAQEIAEKLENQKEKERIEALGEMQVS